MKMTIVILSSCTMLTRVHEKRMQTHARACAPSDMPQTHFMTEERSAMRARPCQSGHDAAARRGSVGRRKRTPASPAPRATCGGRRGGRRAEADAEQAAEQDAASPSRSSRGKRLFRAAAAGAFGGRAARWQRPAGGWARTRARPRRSPGEGKRGISTQPSFKAASQHAPRTNGRLQIMHELCLSDHKPDVSLIQIRSALDPDAQTLPSMV